MSRKYKANILWIDDEPDLLEFFSRFWKKRGYKVSTFKNGYDALEELKQQNYDLLVTDLNKPDMDGRELIRRAKKLKPDLLTILCSGSKDTIRIAKEIGCDAGLKKPIILEHLEGTIKGVLEPE